MANEMLLIKKKKKEWVLRKRTVYLVHPNSINLQTIFNDQWNEHHPHTDECVSYSLSFSFVPQSDDHLICHVHSIDLDEDISDTPNHPNPITSLCICPAQVRPRPSNSNGWTIQEATKHSFLQAHAKPPACANSPLKHRNDLFACTNMLFHLGATRLSRLSPPVSTNLQMVFKTPTSPLPLYFVLSDSHSKFLPPLTTTPTHRIIIKSIFGLRWLFTSNRDLCATYQLQQSNISSYLSSSKSIMMLIGTNSIRSSPASTIIEHIENLIHLLRHLHPHLCHKDSINIVATF